MSVAGPDLLCVSSSKESQEILRRIEREATFTYQTLTLTEENAANLLYINGTLVHRSYAEIPLAHQVCLLILIEINSVCDRGDAIKSRMFMKNIDVIENWLH